MLSKCVGATAASVCFAISLLTSNAFAGVYEFTSAQVATDSSLSLGFTFSTNSAVTVTSLGYYDDQLDGFATSHEVGIFNSLGNLLTSAFLSAGTGNSLSGD